MGNEQHGPAFWACGEATGGELWLGSSPGVLLSSIIPGYGLICRAETIVEGGSWSELLKEHRFDYACGLAKAAQRKALVAAREEFGWSTITESSENLDRLYAEKSLVPSSASWASVNPLLVVVHPIMKALYWDPPTGGKSLIVIDPRAEISLLRGMLLVGALDSAGRIDARSRVADPYDM
ncbi:hypothetical protein [Cryobacterium sp. 10I5]|uniref:hypothetical protein n=1 Tax=Cryobacterium sp. 10I5 TaxID=3048581 RepID=UPI002B226516|nr:hypothetical protein [Cryobacterium sp. 10I5]MEB0266886.1 hypothetical protein [Cryobacterium sp. 10I5]